jgi:hypothetical protein
MVTSMAAAVAASRGSSAPFFSMLLVASVPVLVGAGVRVLLGLASIAVAVAVLAWWVLEDCFKVGRMLEPGAAPTEVV